MAQERKRVESKPIPVTAPKKRLPIVEEPIPERTRIKLDDKYVKVSANEKAEICKSIGERVQRGELGRPYFTTENDKGYLYYIILKEN